MPIIAQEDGGSINDPSSSTTINLVFVIISSKNHAPKFTCQQLIGNIPENAPMMSPIAWEPGSNPQVIDGDPGSNGKCEPYTTFHSDFSYLCPLSSFLLYFRSNYLDCEIFFFAILFVDESFDCRIFCIVMFFNCKMFFSI